MIHIVTLFAQNYMSRGLAMMESVQRHSSASLRFTVLAMDTETYSYLEYARIPNLTIISIDDFCDDEFAKLVGSRPFRELCWTAASCLTNYAFNNESESEFIIYIDADCYFFSDIMNLCSSWRKSSNIFVHEHRYSASRAQWEAASGKFNVGVVGFRGQSSEARTCLATWRRQVLNVCVLNPELGLCGDQGYLNEWPISYPGLQIMTSAGEGAAPWNIEDRAASKISSEVFISGEKLVFYHFHALRMFYNSRIRIVVSKLAVGYVIPKSVRKLIYRPYLRHLHGVTRRLQKHGLNLTEIGLTRVGFRGIVGRSNARDKIVQVLK